jgi:hypothetical protein
VLIQHVVKAAISAGLDAVRVAENGPGLPIAVLDRSLDYVVLGSGLSGPSLSADY